MKNLGYVAFDSFLTDVKIVFSNLKRLDNRPAGVEDVEQVQNFIMKTQTSTFQAYSTQI